MPQPRRTAWAAPDDPAIADFLAALQSEQGAAHNTVAADRRDPREPAVRLRRANRSLAEASAEDVIAWMEALQKAGRKSSTVARRLAAARGFFRHLGQNGTRRGDPTEHIERPRPPRPLPKTLSPQAAAALVESPDVSSPRGLRDRALLELLYASGLRATECLTLAMGDVNLSAGYVQCMGKARKERIVPVGEEALAWIRRYLSEVRPRALRGRRDPGRLFLSPRGGALTRQALWYAIRPGPPASGPTCHRTPCATVSPVTSWRAGPISGWCRRCWATRTSARRRSTRTCPQQPSARCTASSTPAPELAGTLRAPGAPH